jgi:predicted AAA+ superfamily ATPase
MKNTNENLISISEKVIKNLGITHYMKHIKTYRSNFLGQLSENELRKEALKWATNDFERTYIFVNRVLKQINLLLL